MATFVQPRIRSSATEISNLASLLKKYGKSKDILQGRYAHSIINARGLDGDTYLANCLIQMYGDCGCTVDARSVFDHTPLHNVYSWNLLIHAYAENEDLEAARAIFGQMPDSSRDVVSWNVIIKASSKLGQSKEALHLFHQMNVQGFAPNNITFVSVLDACSRSGSLECGQIVHSMIIEERIEFDCFVGTAVITMYGKSGSLSSASAAFEKIVLPNVVSYTALIAALAHNGYANDAMRVFYEMQVDGVPPNNISFVCAVDACCELQQLCEGHKIHAAIVCCGEEQDTLISTNLINMYAKCYCPESAYGVFFAMKHRNVVSWNAAMAAYNLNKDPKSSLILFYQLWVVDVKPDEATFLSALEACDEVREGRYIHAAIIESCYDGDLSVGNALIDMYGKCICPEDASMVFSRICVRDTISWTSLISAYVKAGRDTEAIELLKQMQIANIKPDKITYVCAIVACSTSSTLTDGELIHAAITESNYNEDTVVGNALVNLYGNCGSTDNALKVFDSIPARNVVSWTALITAFASNGKTSEAMELFQRMLSENVKPNQVTFVSVISACSRSGYLSDGWKLFSAIDEIHSIRYTKDHYTCMIDLLSRAGHLKEAQQLITNAPFENINTAWLSLLGACKIHSDIQYGTQVANACFQLGLKTTAPYVLMSNICG